MMDTCLHLFITCQINFDNLVSSIKVQKLGSVKLMINNYYNCILFSLLRIYMISVKLEIKAFKTIIDLKFKILVYYLVNKKT